jgi:hypothetical protein
MLMALHWMPRSYYAKWREGNELLYSIAELRPRSSTLPVKINSNWSVDMR